MPSFDMKTALESLTLVGEVDVSRSISDNGFTWTITHTSDRGARTKLIPNTYLSLSAPQGPGVKVTGFVEASLHELQAGIPYYARVTAYNANGWGQPKSSNPSSLSPAAQRPPTPRLVRISPVSNTEVLVQWKSPVHSGGFACDQVPSRMGY